MTPTCIEELARSASAAPSADNSQPWHFSWDGEALHLEYDAERVAGRTFPAEGRATLLAMGGAMENILQAAESAGLPATLEVLPEKPPSARGYAKIDLAVPGQADCEIGGHPLFSRHTNRFPFRKAPIPGETEAELSGMSQGNARVEVFTETAALRKIANLVLGTSEIRFQTQEVHEWLEKSLRFDEESVKKGDGLDVRTLDLPPGGREFLRFISPWKRMKTLNRLGMYHLLARIDARPVGQAPAVAAFVAPPDPLSTLDAGRLLDRAWIYLNSRGIAVHPYYVVSDQLERLDKGLVPDRLAVQLTELRKECGQLFGFDSNETLHMLFRIGYPTREPPRSLRLPLEKVFTDLTRAG